MTWKNEKCTIILHIAYSAPKKKIVIIIVKIGLHVDTEAIRKQIVTFLLRWLLSGTIFPHRSLLNIVI